MPTFEYRCPVCGSTCELRRAVADRDAGVHCVMCLPAVENMQRVPAAPGFAVHGFNAANRYSAHSAPKESHES